jgi:membrane protein
MDPASLPGLQGKSLQMLQLSVVAGGNFLTNNGLLRATALSFTTLLSLVPLLAIAFSVLKGLGVQNRIAPMILKQVMAGSEVAVNRIIQYIGNTNMSSVGAIGLVALLYTTINMLANVEAAFNAVWGVTQTRSLYRKFSDYLSVLVSAPLLFLAATSITTTLHSQWLFDWLLQQTYLGDVFLLMLSLTRYLSVWGALFLMYMFIPNTKVSYRSALIGAVLAGTVWQFAQWCYINFQIGAGNYNAIYGTLAALPILMVWLYVSWIIVLYGMEVVAAHQHMKTFRRDLRGEISQSFRDQLAFAVLRHIIEAFHQGGPGWEEEHLAVRLGVPLRVVRETLEHLMKEGYLIYAEGEHSGFFPGRELDQVPLAEVLASLRRCGNSCELHDEPLVKDLLAQAEQAVSAAFHGLTLKDLAAPENIPGGVDKGGKDGI